MVNEKEVRVIGMSRSGNHAIVRWITGLAGGRSCFLNCCEGKSNPFESARPLPSGVAADAGYPEFDLAEERLGRFTRKDLLIYNYEDSFLGHACSPEFERRHDEWVGPSRDRFDVLILRDPFNLFASRIHRREAMMKVSTALRVWKQHARQHVGAVDRLPQRPVLLNYNRWFASGEYRAEVAGRLGLATDGGPLRDVPACLGGSSFDGLAYDGSAEQMRVLERWRRFGDDASFRAIFDGQTVELARAVFGGFEELAPWFEPAGAARRAG